MPSSNRSICHHSYLLRQSNSNQTLLFAGLFELVTGILAEFRDHFATSLPDSNATISLCWPTVKALLIAQNGT